MELDIVGLLETDLHVHSIESSSRNSIANLDIFREQRLDIGIC